MQTPPLDNFAPIGQEPIEIFKKNYNLKTKGSKLVNLVSIDISFKARSYILNKNTAQIKITQLIKHIVTWFWQAF